MPGKDQTPPPPAAPAAPPIPRADAVLKGLAGLMAEALRKKIEAELKKGDETDALETARRMAVLARAAVAVQQMQAAEDRAVQRAEDRAAHRAAALARAKFHHPEDEGDDTDMHERDPRLDTPEGVAEIHQAAERGLDRLLRSLEAKRARGRDDGGRSPGLRDQLAEPEPDRPAAAH